MRKILQKLIEHLRDKGKIDLTETYIDATFVEAKKGGKKSAKQKSGKGSKIMAITDKKSLPLALSVESASPHESGLVEGAIRSRYTRDLPERIVGDKAYDSYPLDEELARRYGIELIAPHKSNRVAKRTQDGRTLRRYRKRWCVERFFSWIQHFRKVETRYERKPENFLGMVELVSIIIVMRSF